MRKSRLDYYCHVVLHIFFSVTTDGAPTGRQAEEKKKKEKKELPDTSPGIIRRDDAAGKGARARRVSAQSAAVKSNMCSKSSVVATTSSLDLVARPTDANSYAASCSPATAAHVIDVASEGTCQPRIDRVMPSRRAGIRRGSQHC